MNHDIVEFENVSFLKTQKVEHNLMQQQEGPGATLLNINATETSMGNLN